MKTLTFLAYLLLVMFLAFLYCLIAGWDVKAFVLMVILSPIFMLIWFLVIIMTGVFEPSGGSKFRMRWLIGFNREKRGTPLLTFWAWTVYCFSSVIFRLSSILLGKLGFATLSSFLYSYRYANVYLLPVFLALIVIVAMVLMAFGLTRRVCV